MDKISSGIPLPNDVVDIVLYYYYDKFKLVMFNHGHNTIICHFRGINHNHNIYILPKTITFIDECHCFKNGYIHSRYISDVEINLTFIGSNMSIDDENIAFKFLTKHNNMYIAQQKINYELQWDDETTFQVFCRYRVFKCDETEERDDDYSINAHIALSV